MLQPSSEARELITLLLEKNQQKRICIKKVKRHEYFSCFDFNLLFYKKAPAPFKPNEVIRPRSTSCESNEYDSLDEL
jgi:hypothetical protein